MPTDRIHELKERLLVIRATLDVNDTQMARLTKERQELAGEAMRIKAEIRELERAEE